MRPGQQCRGAKLTSAHIKNTRGRVAVSVRVVTKASIVRVFSWGAKYIGGRNEPRKIFFFNHSKLNKKSLVLKVENFLKDSLDSISSPSSSLKHLNIIFLAKNCWALSTNFLSKKSLDSTQPCFAFNPQANFSDHSLNL